MPADPLIDTRLSRRLSDKKMQLDTYRPLVSEMVQRLHGDFRVMFMCNSNAIEGNTLTLSET